MKKGPEGPFFLMLLVVLCLYHIRHTPNEKTLQLNGQKSPQGADGPGQYP
jgi:hypothetical protein